MQFPTLILMKSFTAYRENGEKLYQFHHVVEHPDAKLESNGIRLNTGALYDEMLLSPGPEHIAGNHLLYPPEVDIKGLNLIGDDQVEQIEHDCRLVTTAQQITTIDLGSLRFSDAVQAAKEILDLRDIYYKNHRDRAESRTHMKFDYAHVTEKKAKLIEDRADSIKNRLRMRRMGY